MSLHELPEAPSSIHEKIKTASGLLDTWESALRQDPLIAGLLNSLHEKTANSQKAMLDLGVVAACRHCDEEDGGSCCGAGIEKEYNAVLLLLNLLSGVTLPDRRLWANSCFFLTQNGCALKVRNVLCINYLCLTIQKMLEPDHLILLQTATGEEMDTVFQLHETVKKFMAHRS